MNWHEDFELESRRMFGMTEDIDMVELMIEIENTELAEETA